MKKIFKIFLSFVVIVLLLGIVGCNAGTNELQSKLDSMQSQLEEMNNKLIEMEEQIQDLEDKMQNEEEEVGTFYSLQEAYDKGFLTREDLQSIANYHNNGEVCADKIDEAKVWLIKESAAKRMREREIEPIVEAKAEGFDILGYYGKYADCYAVEIRDIYDLYPTDVPNYWLKIGGVDFHITSYDTIGCCKFN